MWFPGGLEGYWTFWPIPPDSEARISVVVLEGSGASMKGVYSSTYEGLAAETYSDFTGAVDVPARGFYLSDWIDAEAGDLYIGIVAEGDLTGLVVGLAEVQIRAK